MWRKCASLVFASAALAAGASAKADTVIDPASAVKGTPGPIGMIGTVYHNDADATHNWGANTLADMRAFQTAGNTYGTYSAHSVAYFGGDATPIGAFLGADGASLTPIAHAATPLESSLIDLKGYLNVAAAGTYTFGTLSDDSSYILIGGQTVVDNHGTHPTVYVQSNATFSKPGLYPIEVAYDNQGFGGGGIADVVAFQAFPLAGTIVESVHAVPAPASVWGGLGLVGGIAAFALRRRAASVA